MILMQFLRRIGTGCLALQASEFLYKLLPFFDGLCYTSLATFFLSSIVLKFVHDEASGFDRHFMGAVWCLRSTFGFDALPFVGVVFFSSSSLVGVVLFPSPAH